MTQPKALLLDEIVRIYKNSAGRVIGLHSIAINEYRELIPNLIPGKVNASRFKRSATIHSKFDRLNYKYYSNDW
jgi:hypothetical protein